MKLKKVQSMGKNIPIASIVWGNFGEDNEDMKSNFKICDEIYMMRVEQDFIYKMLCDAKKCHFQKGISSYDPMDQESSQGRFEVMIKLDTIIFLPLYNNKN